MPKLIVSSDDFGLSEIYNAKMIEMAQARLLSSISVLVRRNLKEQSTQLAAIKKLNDEKHISLGLHLEIAATDGEAVFEAQWKAFESLMHRRPDYLDIHKGHFHNVNFNVVAGFCLEKSIPFRKYEETTIEVRSPVGTLTATNRDLDTIEKWLNDLEPGLIYELVFHVGTFDPNSKSSLNRERERDVDKLLVLQTLIADKNISVVTYKSLLDQ